jgi:hypothetical protein
MMVSLLPAGFAYARDLSPMGQLPEAVPAQAELPHIAVGAAADLAPVDFLTLELRLLIRLVDLG